MKINSILKCAGAGVPAGLCLCLLSAAVKVEAANGADTWTGASSANWSAAGNWSGANTPPIAGDSLIFGAIGTSGATLNNNLLGATNSFSGITFNAGAGAFTLNGNAVSNNAAIVDNAMNLETINLGLVFAATHPLTTAKGATLQVGGAISGAGGITANGAGTVTLTNANVYTGITAVNGGTLKADFSGAAAPAMNILPAASVLSLGGGTLSIIGNGSTASYQTNASLTLGGTGGAGAASVISVSGGVSPTVYLGAIATNTGSSVVFNGPATINGAGNVSATATILTTTGGQGASTAGTEGVMAGGGNNNAYATVGLYDWASVDTTGGSAGTSPYTIVGGSQVTGFYVTPGNNAGLPGGLATAQNNDIATQQTPTLGGTANNVRISATGTAPAATLRFNSGHAVYVNVKSGDYMNSGGVLITPNMGPINCGIDNLRLQTTTCQIVQNNTAAVFCLGINGYGPYFSNSNNGGEAVVISGAGAVFLNPVSPMNIAFNYLNASSVVTTSSTATYNSAPAGSSTWGAYYLNGGVTVINSAAVLGNPTTQTTTAGAGGTVNLNGGTLMAGYGTNNVGAVNLINAAAANANRPVFLGNNGGGLAAQSSTTLTVGGLVANTVAGAGALVIGIPASSANGNVPGLVPGTGTGTSNSAFNATGTVVLTNANSYTGGTVVDSGTLNINGIYALGGANYAGLTLNGGNLQYAAGFTGNGSGDLTSVGTNGITLATNATVDVNGNAVTYGSAIGNGGSGSLTVQSTIANGSLTLSGANSYTGNTTVSGGTLKLASGASLASTNVTVASGAILDVSSLSYTLAAGRTLLGSGVVTGSVATASTASIVPGASGTAGTLSFSNNLTLGGGTTNYFTLSGTTNGANSKVIVAGALNLSGLNTLAINFTAAPGIGRYKLITCSSKTGTAAANLTNTLSGVSIGALVATLSDSVSGEIDLVLSSAHTPSVITWIGDGTANNWDTATLNWTNVTGGPLTTYYDFDYVTFDDHGYTNPPVNLTKSLTPNSTTVNSVNNYQFSGPGSIAYGSLTKTNTGALLITTTNALPGPIAILGGTLQLGDGTNSGTIGTGVITNNAALILDSPATVATGPIVGSGNVTVDTGTLVIGGTSSLGSLTLGASGISATLDLSSNNATANSLTLGSGATGATIGSSSTTTPVTLYYNGTNYSTYGGVIQNTLGGGSQTVALNVNSTGSLTLSGANTYSGGTVISNGIVYFAALGNLGSGGISLPGGTLTCTAGGTTVVTLSDTLNIPAGTTGTLNTSPRLMLEPITGSGTFNLNVNGTSSGYDRLGGGGWGGFAGTINITGTGTGNQLQGFFNGGAFDGNLGNAVVNLDNIELTTYGNSYANWFTFGALSGTSTAILSGSTFAGEPLYVIGGLGTSTTFAGVIQDGSNGTQVRKVGAGTLTLSGANTYTGFTQVSNGVLNVTGSLGNTLLTNYAGAVLTGAGTIGGSVDLENGSTLNPAIGGYGAMTISGNLTLNGGTNLVTISLTNSDVVNVSGSLNLTAGSVKLVINQTLTNGVYNLINYSGSESGGVGNLTLAGFSQAGQIAYLSETTPNQINLVVATPGAANLVWGGSGVAADNLWNVGASADWVSGASVVAFNTGDHVKFDDSGANNSPVDLRAAVQPSTTLVSNTLPYVLASTTGSGSLAGTTNALTVLGSGGLELDMVNTYGGGTTIGTGASLTVGNGSDAASLGSGNIANNGTLTFNQTNSQSLANVSGSGSLNVNGTNTITLAGTYGYTGATTIGSTATLQVGTGSATGPLLGSVTANGTLIMNQSGSLSVSNITGSGTFIQAGSSVMTLSGANTWLGNTYVTHGTLKMGAANTIPNGDSVAGSIGWFILDGNTTNAGTLDLNGYNEEVNLLIGLSGTALGDITNSAASGTSTLTFGNSFGTVATTYAGLITENTNTGAGKIALIKQGTSSNYLSGANSYSGGTILAGGMLGLGNGAAAGSGTITESNGVILGLTAASSIYVNNTIVIGAEATVTNFTTTLGSVFEAPFVFGDANTTNVMTGYNSIGADSVEQFGTNAGTVVIPAGSSVRFAGTAITVNGGDKVTFDVEGTLNTRNGNTSAGYVTLGALTGGGYLTGASYGAGNTLYVIGGANTSSTFSGVVTDGGYGSTAITKVGTGTLTLNGTVTNTGTMTVSNGVLALGTATSLDHSPTLKVGSGSAILDVSGRSDMTLNLGNLAAQTLTGIGAVNGSLNEQANSFVKPGLGALTVSNSITLAGATTLQLNRTNAANCSELVSPSFTISGPLTVTNVGPALQAGDSFQLFSTGVTGFSVTNLPTLTGTLYWTNRLATLGNIAVAGGVATYPTNITYTITSSNTLALSWPADHTGWRLQVQTNNLASGISSTPVDWGTVAGSTTMNATNLPIDGTKPTEFYRLVYP